MHKWALIIFTAALVLRAAALFSWQDETSLYYVSDSYTYRQVAANLIEHGVYSMELSPTPHPDNFRTPLYPFFLFPFVYFKISMYVPVIIQSLIMAIGSVFIYRLATRIWNEKIARWSALLYALEPFTALIGTQLMTEAIFTTLFLPSLLYFALYLKDNQTKYLIFGATLLALSALTRPVAFYLFVLIPLVALFGKNRQFLWKKIFIPLTIFFLIISPWLYFIKFVVKTSEFSSLSSFDMYAYHGVYFDNWRAERGATDRLPYLNLDEINHTLDARPIPKFKEVGLGYITDHFGEYLWYHFIRLPYLWTDSGYASILNGIPSLKFTYDSVKGGFVDQINLLHPYQTFIRPIMNEPFLLVLFVADIMFIITASLALLNPVFHFLKTRDFEWAAILLVAFLLLYTALASPIGGARFRIPVNFLIFALTLDSIFLLIKTRKTDTLPAD